MQLSEYKELIHTPKRKQQPEYELHKKIVGYVLEHYPEALFLSDLDNQIQLTLGQARRNKAIQKDGFKCPDLLILETITSETGKFYAGLFLELKKESPFKKDGSIKASQNDHLKLQAESLEKLRERSYYAQFCWTFEDAKNVIDSYLRYKIWRKTK